MWEAHRSWEHRNGLYAYDAASDLKTTADSLLRLPIGPEEILANLAQQEPSLKDPGGEDYTAFWFVAADPFHRYGIGPPSRPWRNEP